MTREKFRSLDPADACKCSWCDRRAVTVRQWQSDRMTAPAFWYYCPDHEQKELWQEKDDERESALTAGERNR